MSRPYEYNLTWEWHGESLSFDHRGHRTLENGHREEFHNNAYDGRDPAPAIELERTMYKAFGGGSPNGTIRSKSPLGSVDRIVIVLRGDQAKE